MGTAKVVSLATRPLQVSNLCFQSDGIIGEVGTNMSRSGTKEATAYDWLGQKANPSALDTSFTNLRQPGRAGKFGPVDPSSFLYTSDALYQEASIAMLVALRAEPIKAALDSAMAARQNAFFSKYDPAATAAMAAQARSFYLPDNSITGYSNPNSKPSRLARLAQTAETQA